MSKNQCDDIMLCDVDLSGDGYKPPNRMSIPHKPGAIITNKRPTKAKLQELNKGATFIYSLGDNDTYWVLTSHYDYRATNVLTGESNVFQASDLVTPAVFKISVRKLRVR